MKSKFSLLLLSVATLVAASAHASTVTGTAYSVPASTSGNVPTQGNVPGPGATQIGTFTATALMFSGDTNYTFGGFLNSFGAAQNIVYMNGATAGMSLTNILFEFTGTALFTNGTSYNVYHDDGINLYVNGNSVLSAPQGTAPVNTAYTYTGPTGNFNFDFIYANGAPTQADFQTPISLSSTSATPEPSSLVLLGSGLLGTVAAARRRFKKA